jgi:hypothetical protein
MPQIRLVDNVRVEALVSSPRGRLRQEDNPRAMSAVENEGAAVDCRRFLSAATERNRLTGADEAASIVRPTGQDRKWQGANGASYAVLKAGRYKS